MKCFRLQNAVAIVVMVSGLFSHTWAQQSPMKSQEVSEIDGQPVLIKHLPDYENVQAGAVFSTDADTLKTATGNQPVLDVFDFSVGTEAVTAAYPQGRLVIIEFTNPQASSEADQRIHEFWATNPGSDFVYRRIGNYSAFVFAPSDTDAGNALLDQVKYEKSVQWLGEDPFLIRKLERYLVSTSRDIVISTVLVIVLGLASALVTGIVAGFVFFRVRDQKRAARTAFSDAGGLTRLNLDGLTSEIISK